MVERQLGTPQERGNREAAAGGRSARKKKTEFTSGKADGGPAGAGPTGQDSLVCSDDIDASVFRVTDVARTLLGKSEMLVTYFMLETRVAKNRRAVASHGKGQSLGRLAFVEQSTHPPRRGQGAAIGKAVAGSRKGWQRGAGGVRGHMAHLNLPLSFALKSKSLLKKEKSNMGLAQFRF